MTNYALIKDNIVENIVVWDGEDGLFKEFTTCVISDDEQVAPGYSAKKDDAGKWNFAAPAVIVTPEEKALGNLQTAQSDYDSATNKITALNEQIEDSDWSGTSEEVVKASLTSWTTYRKELRAYLKAADGGVNLPKAPD